MGKRNVTSRISAAGVELTGSQWRQALMAVRIVYACVRAHVCTCMIMRGRTRPHFLSFTRDIQHLQPQVVVDKNHAVQLGQKLLEHGLLVAQTQRHRNSSVVAVEMGLATSAAPTKFFDSATHMYFTLYGQP